MFVVRGLLLGLETKIVKINLVDWNFLLIFVLNLKNDKIMKTNLINVSKEQLISILNDVTKSTFINLVTETKVRMNKTNNPYFDRVFKLTFCNYLIGNEYETRVNNNYSKEGMEKTFESEQSKVGTHISKCVLYNEKLKQHYLQVERFDNVENIPDTKFLIVEDNGEISEIQKSEFVNFLPPVYESKKQEQDKKVMVISPKIENIKRVSINSERLVVE
jgi:hypothetical protein